MSEHSTRKTKYNRLYDCPVCGEHTGDDQDHGTFLTYWCANCGWELDWPKKGDDDKWARYQAVREAE